MKIKEYSNDVAVALSGRLDVHTAAEVEREINQLIEKFDKKNLILNLTEVEYMSSSGLRVFVTIMRQLKEKNRILKLCSLSPSVRKIFEVVELMDMFDVYDSEEKAASS